MPVSYNSDVSLPDPSTADPAEYVNAVINYAVSTAAAMTGDVASAADGLISEKIGMYIPWPSTSTGFAVSAEEPEVPEVDGDWLFLYHQELERIIKLLWDELADFFATYYPLENDAFDEATAKVIDMITNGGTGIPEHVEEQIWQRARERMTRDGMRLEDSIERGYAAKGHTLPQGSMTKKIEQARYAQLGPAGESSTNIALKQAEIEIENIKFAIDWALRARTMAMQSAADYIRSIANTPPATANVIESNSSAKARMMSATADFYRARLSRDELVLKSATTDIDQGLRQWKDRHDVLNNEDRTKIQALATAAESYGKAAQAALMSLNTIASTATSAFS